VFQEKARELGRLIGQSDEYKALKRAQDRLGAPEAGELRARLERLKQMDTAMKQRLSQGQEPSAAEAQAYQDLFATIEADPMYQGMISAQYNFDKLMAKVDQQIMEGIIAGASSPIITLS